MNRSHSTKPKAVMRSMKLALVALSLAASVLAFSEAASAQEGRDGARDAPAVSRDAQDGRDGGGQPDDENSSRPTAPAMQLVSKNNYPRKPGNGLAIINSHPVPAQVPPLPGGLLTEAGAVTRSLSYTGQFAVFTTSATDLVAAPDRNPGTDVFVWDSIANIVKVVTTDSSGVQRSGFSGGAEIDPFFSRAIFWSTAEDLAPNQTITGNTSLFVKDIGGPFGATALASVDNNGNELAGNVVHGSIAGAGRFVAFQSDSDQVAAFDNNQTHDIFLRDLHAGTTTLVSTSHASPTAVGNRASTTPSLSATGEWLVYASRASNLVPGDTNSRQDIFVYQTTTGLTERVSVAPTGSGNANHHSFTPTISADGRFVSFSSLASNLVAGDNNGKRDIFVFDRVSQSTERVTIDLNGNNPDEASYRPTISHDGSTVVFTSASPDLVADDTNNYEDVFVWDRPTKTIERVQSSLEPDSVEYAGSPSGDGSRIIFDSGSHNLIPGQWSVGRHVYSFDR